MVRSLCTIKTECPICKKLVYETSGGTFGIGPRTMYAHGPKGSRCPGSGMTVAAARASLS